MPRRRSRTRSRARAAPARAPPAAQALAERTAAAAQLRARARRARRRRRRRQPSRAAPRRPRPRLRGRGAADRPNGYAHVALTRAALQLHRARPALRRRRRRRRRRDDDGDDDGARFDARRRRRSRRRPRLARAPREQLWALATQAAMEALVDGFADAGERCAWGGRALMAVDAPRAPEGARRRALRRHAAAAASRRLVRQGVVFEEEGRRRAGSPTTTSRVTRADMTATEALRDARARLRQRRPPAPAQVAALYERPMKKRPRHLRAVGPRACARGGSLSHRDVRGRRRRHHLRVKTPHCARCALRVLRARPSPRGPSPASGESAAHAHPHRRRLDVSLATGATVPLAQDAASAPASTPTATTRRGHLRHHARRATSATRRWLAVETGTLSLDERRQRASPVGTSPVVARRPARRRVARRRSSKHHAYCISSTQCAEVYSPAMVMKYMLADGARVTPARVAIRRSLPARAICSKPRRAPRRRRCDLRDRREQPRRPLVERPAAITASQLSGDLPVRQHRTHRRCCSRPRCCGCSRARRRSCSSRATDWSCRVDYPPSTVHSVWRNSYGAGVMSSAEYLPFGIEWSYLTQFYSMAPRASATPTDARADRDRHVELHLVPPARARALQPHADVGHAARAAGARRATRPKARSACTPRLREEQHRSYSTPSSRLRPRLAACRLFVCTAGDDRADVLLGQALESGVIPVVLRGPEIICRGPRGSGSSSWRARCLRRRVGRAARRARHRARERDAPRGAGARAVDHRAATKATVAHKLADAATRYWDADDVPANDCVAEKLSASQEAAYQHQMDAFYAQDHWWDNYEDSPFIAGVEVLEIRRASSTVHNSTACVSPRCANPWWRRSSWCQLDHQCAARAVGRLPSRVLGDACTLRGRPRRPRARESAGKTPARRRPRRRRPAARRAAARRLLLAASRTRVALASCALASPPQREQNVGVLRRLFARACRRLDAKLPSDAAHCGIAMARDSARGRIVLVYLVTIIGSRTTTIGCSPRFSRTRQRSRSCRCAARSLSRRPSTALAASGSLGAARGRGRA